MFEGAASDRMEAPQQGCGEPQGRGRAVPPAATKRAERAEKRGGVRAAGLSPGAC